MHYIFLFAICFLCWVAVVPPARAISEPNYTWLKGNSSCDSSIGTTLTAKGGSFVLSNSVYYWFRPGQRFDPNNLEAVNEAIMDLPQFAGWVFFPRSLEDSLFERKIKEWFLVQIRKKNGPNLTVVIDSNEPSTSDLTKFLGKPTGFE